MRQAFFLAALLGLAALTSANRCGRFPAKGVNKAAAFCIFRGGRCGHWLAVKSAVCTAGKRADRQGWKCRGDACGFCACYPKAWACKSRFMRDVCNYKSGLPRGPGVWNWAEARRLYPKKKKPMSPKKPKRPPPRRSPPRRPRGWRPPKSRTGSCVRRGIHGRVSIPAGYTNAVRWPWARARSGRCLVWKPNKAAHTVDSAGKGVICYEFTVDKASTYYFTMTSHAPHPVDFNDVWVKFMNGGFRRRKPGTDKFMGGFQWGWLKAYQNKGGMKRANEIFTVDFNGHQFETPKLVPRKVYKVCLAGRSSKFEICKLHFASCNGWSCNRGPRLNRMVNHGPFSPCY